MTTSTRLETLTETVGKVSVDNSEVRPGCLGKLSGTIADFNNPTRNGRLYPRDLWVNVFEKTPWVKEALETKTLFGEADHPDDRLESKIVDAAVVLTDYNINDSKGLVEGSFDILDTPNGRILKTLADYGSTLGVSTRGQGSTIEKGGQTIVDPETYVFAGVDVVILPAVKAARQTYVNESVNEKTLEKGLKETLLSEVERTSSQSQLSTLKSILESADLNSEVNEAVNQGIESKLLDLSKDSTTVDKVSSSDLEEAYSQISSLKSDLSKFRANTISLHKYKRLSDMLSEAKHANVLLKSKLSELSNDTISKVSSSKKLSDTYKEELDRQAHIVDLVSNENTKLDSQVSSLKETSNFLKQASESHKRRSERKLNKVTEALNKLSDEYESLDTSYKNLKDTYLEEESNYKRRVNKLSDKVTELTDMNESLLDKLDDEYKHSQALIESISQKELTERKPTIIKKSVQQVKPVTPMKESKVNHELLEGYIKSQLKSNGLSYEENKGAFGSTGTKSEVDNVINILAESRAKINSLPVDLNSEDNSSTSAYLNEDNSSFKKTSNNDDDLSTVKALLKGTKF